MYVQRFQRGLWSHLKKITLTLKLEVSGGFKEEESMELFSSFVNVPVEFLPEEARAIHTECKGSPMVISMIGSLVCNYL